MLESKKPLKFWPSRRIRSCWLGLFLGQDVVKVMPLPCVCSKLIRVHVKRRCLRVSPGSLLLWDLSCSSVVASRMWKGASERNTRNHFLAMRVESDTKDQE